MSADITSSSIMSSITTLKQKETGFSMKAMEEKKSTEGLWTFVTLFCYFSDVCKINQDFRSRISTSPSCTFDLVCRLILATSAILTVDHHSQSIPTQSHLFIPNLVKDYIGWKALFAKHPVIPAPYALLLKKLHILSIFIFFYFRFSF